jgi:beta-barrel assembly-enhancing protease
MAIPQFTGRWTDGRSAGSTHVGIRLERALEIWPSGAAEPVKWSLHRLQAAVPLKANAKDVLLKSQDHPGETLFVPDPAFSAAVLKLAPHLSPGSERWRYLWPGLILAIVVGSLVGASYAFNWSPAKSIAQAIPYSARDAIGQQAVVSFTRGHEVCKGAAGRAALDALAKKLSDAAGTERRFQFDVVNWDMVNAFALPGEHIVILSELIADAKSADELAGVIAHEMGHGIELHPEAGIVRSIGITAAMELIFTGSSGTAGNIGAMLLQLRYSRDAETEADAHALRILQAARISSKPIAGFFDRLTAMEGGGDPDSESDTADPKKTDGGSTSSGQTNKSTSGGLGDLFATHPSSPARAKFFRDASIADSTPALTNEQWQSLRGICSGT